MAVITGTRDMQVLKIKKFLGLNENPDGDTVLKTGELSEMRNFRITKDNHLQIRQGYKTVLNLADSLKELTGVTTLDDAQTRCYGVWRGFVGGVEHTIAAYGGYVWDVTLTGARSLGQVTAAETTFFGFEEKVYLLNGYEYLSWDGGAATGFAEVEPYIPLVQTATTPEGAGTLLEEVNRLTNKRRVEFSPDGEATEFKLPEENLAAIISVKLMGEDVNFAADETNGKVGLDEPPAVGVNTLEVTYAFGEGAAHEVKGMRYSEFYNGSTDGRVFLYGDGSNKTIYSGIRYDTGKPSAEYFPDLFEIAVGEANTPITALVRHYSRMMAFKPNSAWSIQYNTMTLADESVSAAFYVQPVNRQFGNEAAGQVKLLENNPLTIDVGSVYQWRSTSSTSGYISNTENNAKRISDRVAETLRGFDLPHTRTFNIKNEHEYWFLYEGKALILNYANNTWYYYDNLPFAYLVEAENEEYGFCDDGRMVHFSRDYYGDDGEAIDCYAATGAMDFEKDWLLKYSPMLFVAMEPENNARIYVTVETNRRSDYPKKLISYSLANFEHVDFNHFSFGTNRKPQVRRVKMKVKKATYYKLIFESSSASATATIIEADIHLRYAGNVK